MQRIPVVDLSPCITEPWQQALQKFEQELTPAELLLFKDAQPDSITRDLAALDERQRRSSKTRRLSARIQPCLATIKDYGQALDVLANASSVLPPLWGSLRVLIAVLQKYNDYYSRLLDMLEQIGDILPNYSAYSELLKAQAPLRVALRDAYGHMIIFFTRAKSALTKSPMRVFLQSFTKTFDRDFGDCVIQIQRYRQLVEAQVRLGSVTIQVQEARRAEEERGRAENSRKQVERLQAIANERRRGELKLWLRARKCVEEKIAIEDNRIDGTCDWILQREEVEQWIQTSNMQVLWIHGPPGCGKSFIYGRLLKSIEEKGPTLYFLFCGGDKERVTLASLLRSWCLQLLDLFPHLSECVEAVKSTDSCPVATDADIMTLFRLMLEKADPVYLTVDAIDECLDGSKLFTLIANVPKKFKILVTSRTPANIRRDLAGISSPLRTLEIKPEFSQADIDSLIDSEVNQTRFPYHPDVVSKIKERLAASEGMFLWVKLMIDQLQWQTCEFEILQCLQELPEGLTETYQRIMEHINKLPVNRKLLAYKVFFWGLTVMRPVCIEELCCLLAIQPKSDEFDRRRVITDADSTILSVSRGLIQLRGSRKMLYFAHFTITEYLRQQVLYSGMLGEIMASYNTPELVSNDSLAAAVCLRFLCYDSGEALPDPESHHEAEDLISNTGVERALLDYAISHWFKHFQQNTTVEPLIVRLVQLLHKKRSAHLRMFWLLNWTCSRESIESLLRPGKVSGFPAAAGFGLDFLLPMLPFDNDPNGLPSSSRSTV